MELIGVTYSGIVLAKNSVVYFNGLTATPLTPAISTNNLIGITLEGLTSSQATYIALSGRIVTDTRNFEVLDSLYVGTYSQLTNVDPGLTYSIRVGTVLKKSIIGEFEFTPTYVRSIIGISSGGTGLTSAAVGSILGANTLNTWSQINSTSGLKVLQNSSGVISWNVSTGTGSNVYSNGPTLVNPIVNTQTSLDNSTKAASTAYVDRLAVSPKFKSSLVTGASFSGNPKKMTYTFITPYTNLNYSINITGSASRSWSYENKTTASFVINSNSNTSFTTEVSIQTNTLGEN